MTVSTSSAKRPSPSAATSFCARSRGACADPAPARPRCCARWRTTSSSVSIRLRPRSASPGGARGPRRSPTVCPGAAPATRWSAWRALAASLIAGSRRLPAEWRASTAVMHEVTETIGPALDASADAETAGLLTALDGRFVAPGAAGAPTRGRPGRPPDGPELLFCGYAPSANRRGLATGMGLDPAPGGTLRPNPRRLAAGDGAQRLGHLEYAHRRRRYRPGVGAHRRAPALGGAFRPGDRLRNHAARPARPAAESM